MPVSVRCNCFLSRVSVPASDGSSSVNMAPKRMALPSTSASLISASDSSLNSGAIGELARLFL